MREIIFQENLINTLHEKKFLAFVISSAHSDAPNLLHTLNQNYQSNNIKQFLKTEESRINIKGGGALNSDMPLGQHLTNSN